MAKRVLTGFMGTLPDEQDAMCHCFTDVESLNEKERKSVREEHTVEELRTECSPEELEQLGIAT